MATAKTTKKKKRVGAFGDKGVAHINASFNNTLVVITDINGNKICQSSAGACGLKGSRKSTPYAAGLAAEAAAKVAFDQGIRSLDVEVKGAGQGRETAIRSLTNCGITLTSIKDVSPIPHNGCRPPKIRRN